MTEFLANNCGSIIVGAFIFLVCAGVIVKLIRDKKSGKSSCSCGCSSCPGAAVCRGAKQVYLRPPEKSNKETSAD